MLIRLGRNGQLDPQRWAVLFDPRTGVPQALGRGPDAHASGGRRRHGARHAARPAAGRRAAVRPRRRPGALAGIYIEFFRAIPLLVVIFALYFLLPKFGIELSAYQALTGGLVLYNSAVLAEIFRAGILSIDKGQSEAAYGIGMRKSQVMALMLLPQAIRRMLPVLIAQLVVLLKDSSLGFIIGYFELLRRRPQPGRVLHAAASATSTRSSCTSRPALIYIVINVVLSQLAKYVEKRTRRNKKAAAVGPTRCPSTCRWAAAERAFPRLTHPSHPGASRATRRIRRGDTAGTMETMHAAGRRKLPPVPRPRPERAVARDVPAAEVDPDGPVTDRSSSTSPRSSRTTAAPRPSASRSSSPDRRRTTGPTRRRLADASDGTRAARPSRRSPEPAASEPDAAQEFVARLRSAAADFAEAAGAASAVVREAVPPARHRRARCRVVLRYADDSRVRRDVPRPGRAHRGPVPARLRPADPPLARFRTAPRGRLGRGRPGRLGRRRGGRHRLARPRADPAAARTPVGAGNRRRRLRVSLRARMRHDDRAARERAACLPRRAKAATGPGSRSCPASSEFRDGTTRGTSDGRCGGAA